MLHIAQKCHIRPQRAAIDLPISDRDEVILQNVDVGILCCFEEVLGYSRKFVPVELMVSADVSSWCGTAKISDPRKRVLLCCDIACKNDQIGLTTGNFRRAKFTMKVAEDSYFNRWLKRAWLFRK